VLSYARSDGAARASHPSRWLLEQMARREGVASVYASELSRLIGPELPWLVRVASAYDGLQRCTVPADLADRRVRSVIAWHALGYDLAHHPIAGRTDLPLGRALQAGRARRSHAFTEYDGNLGEAAADSRLVLQPFTGEHGASSATALERWAGCPFQYMLVQVLRVEATERPEDEWTITPLDKGSLVHEVYEQFFRELVEQGRFVTPGDAFTTADHERLGEIAEVLFADLEAQGRTGHPLAWDNARASIMADLHTQLERDEAWRRNDGLVPAMFERTFGNSRDPETWPAVEVALDQAGAVLRFRGAIDRVDLSPDDGASRRALVIDYKTGGAWGFDGLDRDPVLAGSHLQLALYARALRSGLPGIPLDEVRAEYRLVSSKGKFQRFQVVIDSQTDARLDEVVRHAAGGIRVGAFLPTPGGRDRNTFKNCRFCDYDRICSTTRDEAAERKKPNVSFVPLERLQ
jgi:ATP-dependent helicase/nuclease subunit B